MQWGSVTIHFTQIIKVPLPHVLTCPLPLPIYRLQEMLGCRKAEGREDGGQPVGRGIVAYRQWGIIALEKWNARVPSLYTLQLLC